MHWKALRINSADGNDSKRRTLFESQPRHSEQLFRPDHSSADLPSRRSESGPRPPHLAEPDGGKQATTPEEFPPNDSSRMENRGSSWNSGTSNWPRNRFSFMRLRHASDPQLSKTYAKGEEDVPPVPSLPPPPTIITTAPTSHEIDQPVKRQNRLQVLPKSKNSSREELPATMHGRNQGQKDCEAQNSLDFQHVDPSSIGEEPGRLSTNSMRSTGHHPNDSHRSSVNDVRFSESSRSDQSQKSQKSLGDRGINRNAQGGKASKRFRVPAYRKRWPSYNSFASKSDFSDDQDHVSPLPSPARSSVGLSSQPPPLLRKDSATSGHSANSNPSYHGRDSPTRPRASTVDSVDNQPSPVLASSGRTSTSTSGRKSFGDIFNFSQRFRQNSEPPLPRNGSPGTGTPMSKISTSSYPAREESDTPATYLSRLEESVPKGTIGGILSRSDEEFYKTALRKYMRGFSFFGDPIDMAIRKLLMEVELPKETQQIDRFLQAFADRYHECNPGIFASEGMILLKFDLTELTFPDQAYFIVFSILILHTDVFNKNNKRKMQKPDYVKNTRGEGIAEDILECFYENISYTPFIHIEDANLGARHLPKPRRALFRSVSSENLRTSKEPVDPYALILEGKLDSLRPSLKEVMDLDDTYSCTPTTGPPDMDRLHQTFAKTGILQIVSARSRPDAFVSGSIDNPAESHPGLVDIKVAKVGLLWRKDPKKKRTRSPWQEWGALLTFSQLYFFRDVNWVKSLMSQHDSHQKDGRCRTVVFKPPLTDFRPDGIMSTDDAVALLDSGYKRHKHAFVFVRHNSLEEVFLANSEADMNDWLAKLNYAAAFRTTGVRTKGMIAPNYEGQRYRMSNFHSDNSQRDMDKEPPSPNPETDVAEELVTARKDLMSQRVRESNEKLFVHQKQLDDLLRNARHLQILTPVHARAREQVIMAAGRMAAKVKWVRQDIWRTKCYREVLVRDLGEYTPIAERQFLFPVPNAGSSEPVETSPERIENTNTQAEPSQQVLPEGPETADKTSASQSPSGRRSSVPTSAASSEFRRASRHRSIDDGKEGTKSTSPTRASKLEREPSVLSTNSKMDVSSLGSSRFAPTSIDDGEERILRETGLLEVNSSPRGRKQNQDDTEKAESQTSTNSEHNSRIRRSLHRTLRESRHGHGDRKKARDSMSSAADDDGKNEEGLERKSPRFTVHGKKASIVTFGSEWETAAPEERLKLRKPTPSDEPKALDDLATLTSGTSEGHPQSTRSASTATRRSIRQDEPVVGIFEEFAGNDGDRNVSPPVSPRAPTCNGRLAVPTEDGMASSGGSSGDEASDTQRIQHSPPEQA
ncbi:guanyl-nucleotide exchange factor, partial [Aspergillus sclerotialis]